MTPSQLDRLVQKFFCESYVQERGKARKQHLDHATPYFIQYRGLLWANPYALSGTKGFYEGYPTFPVKPEPGQGLGPKSTSTKSSWLPRVPVHCVLYRWYNNYARIPSGLDISHIRDHSWLVEPTELVAESGPTNRARTACRENGWYQEHKPGCGCVRCPHLPVCKAAIEAPTIEVFKGAASSDISLNGLLFYCRHCFGSMRTKWKFLPKVKHLFWGSTVGVKFSVNFACHPLVNVV